VVVALSALLLTVAGADITLLESVREHLARARAHELADDRAAALVEVESAASRYAAQPYAAGAEQAREEMDGLLRAIALTRHAALAAKRQRTPGELASVLAAYALYEELFDDLVDGDVRFLHAELLSQSGRYAEAHQRYARLADDDKWASAAAENLVFDRYAMQREAEQCALALDVRGACAQLLRRAPSSRAAPACVALLAD
jgi:hypothetical protein